MKNPIMSFLEEHSQKKIGWNVKKEELYNEYQSVCKEKKCPVEGRENFGRILKGLGYKDARYSENGIRFHVWKDIILVKKY